MVEIVFDVVSTYEQMARAGEMSKEAAQKEASPRIIITFFAMAPTTRTTLVNDMKALIVRHPYGPTCV